MLNMHLPWYTFVFCHALFFVYKDELRIQSQPNMEHAFLFCQLKFGDEFEFMLIVLCFNVMSSVKAKTQDCNIVALILLLV